jgi:cellulose synthase/poly-beta-1,6-N-acetylglucosamine synthase-like glycosyltransferase
MSWGWEQGAEMLELESLFWACLAILFYVYFGYPIFCRLLAPIVRRWPRSAPWEPKVSILIPAYNEVDCIEQTVRNKLLLDYPPDKL